MRKKEERREKNNAEASRLWQQTFFELKGSHFM